MPEFHFAEYILQSGIQAFLIVKLHCYNVSAKTPFNVDEVFAVVSYAVSMTYHHK